MWFFFSWILLKIIIHLLSAKSALLQYEEQNKTQFGSKEITRQQIFKGINVLGDSDVLTGSGVIISLHLSSLIAHMKDGKWVKHFYLGWWVLQKKDLAGETQAVYA